MLQYTRLRKSKIDMSQPEKYVKIGIVKKEKSRNNYFTYNGLQLTYCSIGVCNSEAKPCRAYNGKCPYLVDVRYEQPRKNTKKYEEYLEERRIQLEQSALQKFWDEKVERVVYGEATEQERHSIVVMLSHKLDIYELKARSDKSELIRDALRLRVERDKQAAQKNEQIKVENKKVIFDIGEYFYIKISNLPQIKDESDKSLWYRLNNSDAWVHKDNFTKSFHQKIQQNHTYYDRQRYINDIKLLNEQLEENYGMITLFKLED